MKRLLIILTVTGLLGAGVLLAQSEMKILHGDASEHKSGLHAGNQFRTTFYNDGTFGQIDYPPDIGGEWPINSGHLYLVDGNVFVGSEVIDLDTNKVRIVSTVQSANIQYSTGDTGPHGEWWTFLPLRGFSSPAYDKVAMSKWPWSWPASWPDKSDEPDDPGWRIDDEQNLADKNPNQAGWNGYFGRNQFNADEESFFYADDYANQEFKFYPDSTDTLRGGLAIRMKVRGFQWSNALVEDALFCLFDLENIGTHDYDKVVFGYKIGNDLGNTFTGSDTGDDSGAYIKEKDVAYMYDDNGIGNGGWEPVGYFGAAFMESPGNHYDGIDNDGDGQDGPGVVITEDMFAETILGAGDPVIKIDYTTFDRTIETIEDTLFIQYQDRTLTFTAGDTVREIPHNLIDDNLNGLIDESNGELIGTGDDQTMTYLYTGLLSIDYLKDIGKNNDLIDERRDDGIDNDGDWNLITDDDVGQDGSKAPTPDKMDTGEGDGMPTPGEPHFDHTDIDETDMLGLTSFTLYNWITIPQYDDDIVWNNIIPGFFDDLLQHTNVELLYGSGYFPMKTGQIQRFSMAFICGENLDDFNENTDWVITAYSENYKFSQAPKTPNVDIVAGDGYVRLMWDEVAEDTTDKSNKDPVTGWDFEGYRIYRSTDPSFSDMRSITDGKGITSTSPYFQWPLAQFDVQNEYEGYAKVPLKGVHFWLGENLGLKHSYLDTTVTNGFTYYYAVVSYDHGSDSLLIAPTTCARFVSVNQDGTIDHGPNVQWARPEAPVAGYQYANPGDIEMLEGSTTEGTISTEIMYPDSIRDGDRYRITFQETLEDSGATLRRTTAGFTLENITTGDTLFNNSPDFHEGVDLDITEGFRLHFYNVYDRVALNDNNTGWNHVGPWPLDVGMEADSAMLADFEIIFFDTLGVDSSVALPDERHFDEVFKVNFRIWNKTEEHYMKFAFRERDFVPDSSEGFFTFRTNPKRRNYTDEILILDEDSLIHYEVKMVTHQVDTLQPIAGDTAFIGMNKPFLSNDVFEFTMHSPSIDPEDAKVDLDDIRVVPNPYIVSNSWEPPNTYANGRGPRELHFINLPNQCTIRIFNIRGQLIRTLEHDAGSASGTVIWDMKSEEGLDIAYGIYIYHVDAGEVGNKISKFAVIK